MTVVGSRAAVPDEVRRRLDGTASLVSPNGSGGPAVDADPAYLAVVEEAARAAGAAVEMDVSGPWIRVEPTGAARPGQGWKLHVSASLGDDVRTLERVAPLLVDRRVPWKVAAGPAVLSGLNQGEAGLSQIGKFLTVYPPDDTEAVTLARLLDEALTGSIAPRVPSDRRVRAGSVVSYRYGGFDGREVAGPTGELLPAVADPSGRLVPDHRGSTYTQPEWVDDPFEAAGLGEPSGTRLVAGRFLLTALLSRSPRGSVSLGVDLETRTSCVVKQAARGAAHNPWGRDAVDLLRHEERVLRSLAGHPSVPRVVALVDQVDEVHLAMEQVDGIPLAQHVARRTNAGHPPAWGDLVGWCRDVVAVLEHVHSRGLVYRDLKAANALVGSTGAVRLVDFELAVEVGATGDGTLGSRGYCSPQQVGGEPASPADDVWSLGALIYFLVTGAEPALAPDPFDLLARPMTDLAAGVPAALTDMVGSCLVLDPAHRPATVGAVLVALEEAVRAGTTTAARQAPRIVDDAFAEERRTVARRLADSLAEATQRWSGTGVDLRTVDLSLYSGAAGELYALAELAAALSPEHGESALRAARALATLPVESGTGLYHGDAGIGVAIARAGDLLGDSHLARAGAQRVAQALASPAPGSDLVSGLAGQVRAGLLVGEALGVDELLGTAERLAHELARRAQGGDGTAWWTEHGATYLGYAHGVAGVGDVLLDTFDVTGDRDLREVAVAAGSFLLGQARAFGEDGSGAAWTDVADGRQSASMWCHGATGITGFVHRLAVAGAGDHFRDAARAGLRTVLSSRAALGPVLCHGLAGSLELALDLAEEVAEPDLRSLTRLLDAFAWDVDGQLVYVGDSPTQATSGLMTGYAGIALTQARLADRSRTAPVSRVLLSSQVPVQ